MDEDVGSVLRSAKARERDYSEDEGEEADIEDEVVTVKNEELHCNETDQCFNQEVYFFVRLVLKSEFQSIENMFFTISLIMLPPS